jgi:CSLREA domain-containing protein
MKRLQVRKSISIVFVLIFGLALTVGLLAWLNPTRVARANANSAVINVDTPDDELNSDGDCSLREAVESANTNTSVDQCESGAGPDTIMIPAGTYTLTLGGPGENGNAGGDLDITEDLTFQGALSSTTILNADKLDRMIHVTHAFTVNLTIADLTIIGGRSTCAGSGCFAGGGAVQYPSRGVLTIEDSIFEDNATACNGANCGDINRAAGAVFVGDDGDVLIQRSIFRHNKAGCIGALCNSGPSALYVGDLGPSSSRQNTLTIENTTFFSNTGGCASVSCYQGGLMDVNDVHTVTFQSVSFLTNRLVCQALDCHVDEIADIDSAVTVVMNGLVVNQNELECGGDSCGVDSIFVIEDGQEITLTNSIFSENTQICVGDVYTNSEHDNSDANDDAAYACNTASILPFSAEADITFSMIEVMSNANRCEGMHCQAGNIIRFEGDNVKADDIRISWFDVISNSVTCEGLDCHADEILYGAQDPANSVKLHQAHFLNNYLGCVGDACGIDDILDFDSTEFVTVTSSSVSRNVMICVGEVYTGALQDLSATEDDDDIPACNSDNLIEFSPNQKIYVSDFDVLSNTMNCTGESCWLDHLFEIEDENQDHIKIVNVLFEGNKMTCDGLDCQLFEFFNSHDVNSSIVFSETHFINNSMTCTGDSCAAEEFFVISDANWLTYTHGLFYHNQVSCVGDVYTDSLHNSENNDDCRTDYFFRISDGFDGKAVISDVHMISNTVTCEGIGCNTDDFLSLNANLGLSVFNMTILNNYISCEGDGSDLFEQRGCDADEFVDWFSENSVTVRDVLMAGNTQRCDGAGTLLRDGCDTDEIFEVTTDDGHLDIARVQVLDNRAGCSGSNCEINQVAYFDARLLTMTQVTVSGNRVDCDSSDCGNQGVMGIYAGEHGNLSLATVSGNIATCGSITCSTDSEDLKYGGIRTSGQLTFTHVTISGNSSSGPGGGILNAGQLVLVHTTIVSNTANNDGDGFGLGGGICNDINGSGLMTTTVCTGISNNIGVTPTVTIKNSLIANNALDTTASDCTGILTSAGYNLVENIPAGCMITGDTTGNITGIDPDIGPLNNHGGGTETHILHTGSAAIDAIPNGTNGCGTLYVSDQRGMKRPVDDGCEIGSTENVFFLFAPIVHRP